MKSLIIDLHNQLKSGKVTPEQLVKKAQDLANAKKSLNSIITPIFDASNAKFDEKNLLSCIPYSLKDNISTKGIKTTGGSKFLDKYVPPFNATVYQQLNDAGAILLSKDALDEFGLGGTGLYCYTGIVKNPLDETRITGGSSSGSTCNVAAGISTFAIGTDTGDSIRRPASLCGIVGFKPTYGAISRYGVFPYAPSMDHVGILAKYVADVTIVASQLIKKDNKDLTSTDLIKDVKLDNLKELKKINFVVIDNLLEYLEPKFRNEFAKLLSKLEKAGHKIIRAEVPKQLLNIIAFAYQTLTYVEAYSSWSNLTGFTFGNDISSESDDYSTTLFKNRSEGLGDELKRRFTIGAWLSNKQNFESYNLLARQLRHKLILAEQDLLSKGDCLLMPVCCSIAPKIENPIVKNVYDDWLEVSNYSGTPSLSLPFTKVDGMPYGLLIGGDIYQDMKVLNIAYTIESMLGGNNE